MGLVFSIFATIAFAWTVLHGLFSFARWLREPTFEVLNASFATDKKKEGLWVVSHGDVTVVAYGGARTRRIVNSKFLLTAVTDKGERVSAGMNMVVEPILQTIPAHESTKFTLRVQPSQGFEELPERLTGNLSLRVDKYWSRVEFPLQRVSGGDFLLDIPIGELAPWMPVPSWKRALSRLKRLV